MAKDFTSPKKVLDKLEDIKTDPGLKGLAQDMSYKRKFLPEDGEADEGKLKRMSSMFPELIETIDLGIEENSKNVNVLATKIGEVKNQLSMDVNMTLARTELLEQVIGSRVNTVKEMYQAPTIWGIIALLAEFIEEKGNEVDTKHIQEYLQFILDQRIKSVIHETSILAANIIQHEVDSVLTGLNARLWSTENRYEIHQTKIDSGESSMLSLATSVRKLQQRVKLLENCEHKPVQESVIESKLIGQMEALQGELGRMNERMCQLVNDTDNEVIKFFGGLGLRDHLKVWRMG
jgi:hypothetical protein